MCHGSADLRCDTVVCLKSVGGGGELRDISLDESLPFPLKTGVGVGKGTQGYLPSPPKNGEGKVTQ